MRNALRVLLAPIALACASTHAAEDKSYVYNAADDARVKAMAGKLMGELAAKCPVKPVGDKAAFAACRDALFASDSPLRATLKNYILWGRPPGGDINATLKDFRATQFGNDVYTGSYAPMWMWDGKYEVAYIEKDRVFRIIAGVGFRNELDFGQYPYPFWHEPKKWTDYEDANTMALWIDPKIMKVSQLTFFKRADKPAVAQSTRRHMPTFDGKWMWVDDKGQQQPAPMLFKGLYRDANPYLTKLDATYRKLALTMRDAECDSCHVPNNPDKAKRLVLLQTPLHAASEIERVLKDIRQDRMPLDDGGIEKPLPEKLKKQLLADAEAFAADIKGAREWESAQAAKSKPR